MFAPLYGRVVRATAKSSQQNSREIFFWPISIEFFFSIKQRESHSIRLRACIKIFDESLRSIRSILIENLLFE